jgi:MFS family permease
MKPSVTAIAALLFGLAILLAGSGLLGTLLGLRAGVEGYGPALLGAVMSGFFIGFVIGAFVCPPLIRRVGHVRVFAALAALAAAVSLLYGLWLNPTAWFLLRVLHGIAMIGLYMVVESWLNAEAGAARSRVFALYMVVSLLALALGQGLLVLYPIGELAPFMLVGILFCLGLVPIALTRAPQPEQIPTPRLSLRMLWQRAPTGLAGAGFSGMLTGAFWGVGALFAARLGLDVVEVAAFVAAVIAGGALLQWPIGRLSDHHDRRIVLLLVAVATAACTLPLLLLDARWPLLMLAAALLYGGFSFSLYALAVAQTHDRLSRADALDATQGLLLVNGIGAALGPPLAGLSMRLFGNLGFPLALMLIMLLLAAFTAVRIRLREAPAAADCDDFVLLTRTSPVATSIDPRLK